MDSIRAVLGAVAVVLLATAAAFLVPYVAPGIAGLLLVEGRRQYVGEDSGVTSVVVILVGGGCSLAAYSVLFYLGLPRDYAFEVERALALAAP